jgi:hypothetical protein
MATAVIEESTGQQTQRALALRWLPLLIFAISAAAIVSSMRKTSTTFDEIVLIAAGARGYTTGHFDMTPDHPPLMQYLYGLPAHLAHARLPAEGNGLWSEANRYAYSQNVFFGLGNNPEKLAFASRLIGAACALLLAIAVFLFTRRAAGMTAATVAAVLIAFLPDLLAHAGVAYNDVPHALAFFCALWAIDAALRTPTLARGALAGAIAAIALGIKFSAVLIAPIAVLLIIAEAVVRRGDREWLRRATICTGIAIVAAYIATALIYRGDFALAGLRHGIGEQVLHVGQGHRAPAYLLGKTSDKGWWYYFPVAFLFKTPVALHLLIVAAIAGFFAASPRRRIAHSPTRPLAASGRLGARGMGDLAASLLESPLRMPMIGAAVITAALLSSRLDIGFRYALPLMPLVCILVAAGVAKLLEDAQQSLRVAIVLLLVWYSASSLSTYPNFLAYLSEYTAQDEGYTRIADSSLDWGQGLLALREDMRGHGTRRVYLSYFGSAIPEAYGIRYLALPSFGSLPVQHLDAGEPEPNEIVISASNLVGLYVPGDPFARFRQLKPNRVIAGSLYVYRVH